MHFFLGATLTGGCDFGETLTVSGTCNIDSFISTAGARTGLTGFDASEYGAKLVYVVLGKGGLGVFVRAGLVKPPSLVSSAVDADARLALLIIDRRRDNSVVTWISGLCPSTSGFLRAFVRRETFRSI
jgi:hypothetical protein